MPPAAGSTVSCDEVMHCTSTVVVSRRPAMLRVASARRSPSVKVRRIGA
jgi:hypothetical protein